MSAPAMAHDPSDAMRRSSASSSSSDFYDHGMPVVPFHESMSGMTIEKPTILHAHKPHVMPALALDQIVNDPSSYSESDQSSLSETSSLEPSVSALPAPRGGTGGSSGMSLQSPPPRSQGAAFTFEEVMSPRHQNGKRYLGGYLNQRVSMAGGFLKTWKRKYFRLRDHGMLCFKHQDDTTPLFEIHFKAQSVLLVDKPHGALPSSPSAVSSPHATMGYEDAVMLQTTKGKVNASLLFILKHIEIQGHQTPANKVDVPVYLKAENDVEFHAWVENVRLKMEARKRALMQNTVEVAVEGDAAAAKSPATAKNDANLPPRPRIGSTGESVSFSERHGSVPGTDGRTESPAGAHDRTASMSNITEMRSGNGLSTTTAQSNEKTKLQFVAGSTPDPPEFSTFRSKYLLMKEIGEGSFSIVHRAVNRLTGQLCAVKCCKFSHALEEEVMILRKLSHPNIISLEGVYMQEDMFYVVVDYMEDGDLCERLIQKQRFSEAEARQIITQVLLGLEYLHRNNILHRDLKPENILLHGNVVKIADFGLARQLPAATSMLKRSCGTLEYAAPELLRGQAYGLKSDIFSLGVVLYVLLFGTFPFTIESAAALQRMERFPEGVDVRDMSCLHRDSAQWKQVSGLAQDVLLRMLSPSDKNRMSAKELLAHPWFNLTNTPNPVGTPSMGSDTEREAQRIQDCRSKGFAELLARGLDVIKYGKAGNTSPHLTTLQIDFVHGTISWTARGGVLGIGGTQSNRKITDNVQPTSSKKRGARVVSLSDVQEIRVGHTTDAFHAISGSGREPPAAELCVSIVATWRTLDFVVKAIEQRDFVVAGLTRTLEEYRSKHRQS